MQRLTAKFILSLFLTVSLSGVVSAIDKEVRSDIVITTRIGSADGEFGYKTYEDGSWIEPTALAIDSTGNIYISDPLNLRIQKFDKKGKYLSKINIKRNETPGTKIHIIDLTIDKHGNLYALNYFNYIFVFDSNGILINTISLKGKKLAWHQNQGWIDGAVQNQRMALDIAGNIYVQTFNAFIKLDQKGSMLKKWVQAISSYAPAFFLDPYGNLFYQKNKDTWEMFDRNGNSLRVVDNTNNPYPASIPPSDMSYRFRLTFIDAKGNYYYFGLDSQTGDLIAIYKFDKEHKLMSKRLESSLDYNVQRNMVKFDDAGNLYGPTKKAPSKKNKFPLIMKIRLEK